jgi:hypothetical protein
MPNELSVNGFFSFIGCSLSDLERQLALERDRRIRTEQMIDEILKESRSPFVVPALFEAFVMISDLVEKAKI